MNSSLQSSLRLILGKMTSNTSKAICMELESMGWNLSSFPLSMILLWTLTRACSSLDCSNPLRNPNSSSELGKSCLDSSRAPNKCDRAKTNWFKGNYVIGRPLSYTDSTIAYMVANLKFTNPSKKWRSKNQPYLNFCLYVSC